MILQELHKAATKKGFKYELYSTKFNYYRMGKPSIENQIEADKHTYFGFTKDNKVWFWFNILEDDFILFDHRYNTVNGSIIKSIQQEWNAKYILGLQDWK